MNGSGPPGMRGIGWKYLGIALIVVVFFGGLTALLWSTGLGSRSQQEFETLQSEAEDLREKNRLLSAESADLGTKLHDATLELSKLRLVRDDLHKDLAEATERAEALGQQLGQVTQERDSLSSLATQLTESQEQNAARSEDASSRLSELQDPPVRSRGLADPLRRTGGRPDAGAGRRAARHGSTRLRTANCDAGSIRTEPR